MVVVRESWDLQLGVDLTLGPMGQGNETWEFDPSDWDVGFGIWDWESGLGAWALRLRSAPGTQDLRLWSWF